MYRKHCIANAIVRGDVKFYEYLRKRGFIFFNDDRNVLSIIKLNSDDALTKAFKAGMKDDYILKSGEFTGKSIYDCCVSKGYEIASSFLRKRRPDIYGPKTKLSRVEEEAIADDISAATGLAFPSVVPPPPPKRSRPLPVISAAPTVTSRAPSATAISTFSRGRGGATFGSLFARRNAANFRQAVAEDYELGTSFEEDEVDDDFPALASVLPAVTTTPPSFAHSVAPTDAVAEESEAPGGRGAVGRGWSLRPRGRGFGRGGSR